MIKVLKNDYEFSIDKDLNIKSFQNDLISKQMIKDIKIVIDDKKENNAPENGFLISNIAEELDKIGFEVIFLFDEEMELSTPDTIY